MEFKRELVVLILASCVGLSCAKAESTICFPKDFLFGVATAAYQIEGAWNISGKGESIWDYYTHKYPERVFDHTNGDVATDSYHLFKEDVKLLKQLGVKFYRFSISWPRILPTGFSNNVSSDGIRYYRELIDELLQNDIFPLVTMYHWDLPQKLQDLGGWTNPIMADYFVDYAKVLFDAFSDRVKVWITFNEPLSFCHDGYGGDDAPGGRSSGFNDYKCGHNVLRAHAMVYGLHEEYMTAKYNKKVSYMGIALDMPWLEEATPSKEDKEAAETSRQFMFGWFAHPIFNKKGDYPPIMRQRVDENSKRQNFTRSRLPIFTRNEVNNLIGSADFLGLNHYTTYLVSKKNDSHKISVNPSFNEDMGASLSQDPKWPRANSTWLKVVPWGFQKTLAWIKKEYNNPLIIITENGISLEAGINDDKRIDYMDGYLRALHAAIAEDGVSVVGYTHWSLLDNFEWMRGYSERFGLFEVDYKSQNKTRTARKSARYYAELVTTGCLPSSNEEYYQVNIE